VIIYQLVNSKSTCDYLLVKYKSTYEYQLFSDLHVERLKRQERRPNGDYMKVNAAINYYK